MIEECEGGEDEHENCFYHHPHGPRCSRGFVRGKVSSTHCYLQAFKGAFNSPKERLQHTVKLAFY